MSSKYSIPSLTEIGVFRNLDFRREKVRLDLPHVERLDFSQVGKGVWISELNCPKLRELVITLGRGFIGSGVDLRTSPFNNKIERSNLTSLDPQAMSRIGLLENMTFFDDFAHEWKKVTAVVSPDFKVTSAERERFCTADF
jgi:hypothetical protein